MIITDRNHYVNGRLAMHFASILLCAFLCVFIPVRAETTDSSGVIIATMKTIHSKILGEDRKLYIHTPANMKADEAYPVLYLLDGNAHIEMVGGQVVYLSESYKIIPSMIVVGIGHNDRVRELTPTHSITGPDGRPDTSVNAFGRNSGGGEKFLKFMKEELMPYIEASYPTAPYRILSGHSLGGLMAVHCLAWHPDYFNAYIAISPSLQWDDEAALKSLAQRLDRKKPLNNILFFSNGNEGNDFQQRQLKLDSLLKARQVPGLKFSYMPYPGESHTTVPVKAFYDGIRAVYPDWALPLSSASRKTLTAAIVKDHYARLSRDYGYAVIPPQDEINAISRFFRTDPARMMDAIGLLRMNAANHPRSAGIYHLLGDTYLKAGDTANAIRSYKEVLCLNPDDNVVRGETTEVHEHAATLNPNTSNML